MQIREHTSSTKPAIVLDPSGLRLTFAELEARANRLAHHWRRHGVREGDTVALVMENNEHMHVVMWSARRAGLYYVPVNTHLTPSEMGYILTDSEAMAIVASAAMSAQCEQLEEYLTDIPAPLRLMTGATPPNWVSYPECVAGEPDTPIADESEGDLLQYSSGTTGRPKGIRRELPHVTPAVAPNVLTPLLNALGITGNSVYLSPAPLYHTAPSVWSMCVQALGATTVVLERFDAEQALACIERYRITHAQFVPAMFVRMLKLPAEVRDAYDLSSLERVVHAAAPCPPEIKRQMIAWWGPIIDEFYSSSEGAGITFITADEWLQHPGSVGRSLLGTVHILGEDGSELAAGQTGDIYFEGGFAFDYLHDPVKTAASHNPNGWATVGDVGHLDEDGYLYLSDRRHHTIISGGINIYPQEAENLLVSHPRVADAAVFGIPDPEMGQRVAAVVETVDPLHTTDDFADELLEWLRSRLAHFKCPRQIRFETRLPRSDAGKLYKQPLIEKYSGPAE
ncbi:acyl-CoA synthetase [Mycobacterium sp. E342]|uniref:fatty-acid--CoA ligase FadD4 n=1 Tax=unclassified Mycobacterium TaxID=2642494 RepID=UPI00080175AF|nr:MULTISPECIES: fatty-acid--CoA ligase FadD4 [unclassified Mycobacterium]OBH01658.1 acyl-CoA synthetase [Mycobacterium sp. E3247]OBH31497.1 acyl-CoA synthetase [Mycobacterium sp. E342]